MKIYIASALTKATAEHKNLIQELQEKLKLNGHEIMEYFGLGPADSPTEVFKFNLNKINNCDIIIAECTEQSLGTGYEICYGLSVGKKVMAFAKIESLVGRMITGIDEQNFSFNRYRTVNDIINSINTL